MYWECRQRRLKTGPEPIIMGILNVTPDSFSDGGRYVDPGQAVAYAHQMITDGASIVDIGGESTRPGAYPVDAEEECRRVIPVIKRLRDQTDVPISIDTAKASVAAAALQAGADIVNDVSALAADPAMLALVRDTGAGAILMHMQGSPRTMQANPSYNDAPSEIRDWLSERIEIARRAGIPSERLVIDPGIGFGKTLKHNLEILTRLGHFTALGRPVLVGLSRKRFIGTLAVAPETDDRLPGSLAALACAVYNGAQILRVHDVKASRQAARVAAAIREPELVQNGRMELL